MGLRKETVSIQKKQYAATLVIGQNAKNYQERSIRAQRLMSLCFIILVCEVLFYLYWMVFFR
jgi:hypothetical protein